jgi:predicted nicotinamide N-methyase
MSIRDKTQRSCLAIVEADGIFDGLRRVRLSIPHTKKEEFDQDGLSQVKSELTTSLGILTDMPLLMEIEIFDARSCCFSKVDNVHDIPTGNCRLRVTRLANDCTFAPSMKKTKANTGARLLALPWREFNVNLSDGSFRVNNRPLKIKEIANSCLGTGLNVWDGSIALALYLDRCATEFVMEKNILEVGAGTGLVGIAAGFLGAKRVILTDLEYSIANLQENINMNLRSDDKSGDTKHGLLEARVLNWLDFSSFDAIADDGQNLAKWLPDVVLASDVVWVDSLVLPLVQMLYYISSKAIKDGRRAPLIFLSYQCRSIAVEELLFNALAANGFAVIQIPSQEVKSEKIQIFRITL